MAGRLRRGLRHAWRGAWYMLAVGLVLMALVAGITSQLLPLAERNPQRIADWLGARAGRPVSFDRVETAWTRRGPLLRLDGMRIGEGPDAIPIGEAEVLVAQYAGVLPGRSFTELRLRGLELALERDSDGRWRVRGLPGERQAGGDPFAVLEGLGELQVVDGVLAVDAPALGLDLRLSGVDVRLRVDGDRVRAAARAWMRPEVSPLDIAVELDRPSGDARAWFALRRADLSAWSGLRAGGIAPEAGSGRVQAWAELRGYRTQSVVVRGELEGVRVRGDGRRGAGPAPSVGLGDVDIDARWTMLPGGWRFDARRLRLGDRDAAQSLDGLLVAGGAQRALRLDRLDLAPLLPLAVLAPGVPDGLSAWLDAARPHAVLHEVALAGSRDGALRARARVEGLGFAPAGGAPGVSGLSGILRGDAAGVVFTPDPGAAVEVDWPIGFGPPAHAIRLRGDIAAWRGDGQVHVGTGALRIDGEGYGATVRGGLAFQGDGTRPRMDLAAEVDEARVPVAKRFWIRHQMPEAAVAWLDAALVDGRVLDGRAVVSGDLDDWPFDAAGSAAAPGLFHASARLEDAIVRFDPAWPAVEGLDGRVDFIAAGFTLDARARMGGVPGIALRAGIADFGRAPLRVDARVGGDAGPVLALLRDSPLREGREAILDGLAASGPVQSRFGLVLPLGAGAGSGLRIDGTVDLGGTRLAGRPWDLVFEDARGRLRFDHAGFRAEGLRVHHDGRPGRLALRAGAPHVDAAGMAFEAALDASLAATELAERAPEFAWLGARLEGRSEWTLALGLPADAGADGRGGLLQLRSNLVGTRLTLPAPLGKPAHEPLAARVDLKLPLGADDVDVVLGERVALRARTRGGRTGVLAVLGSDRVDQAPPASGLRVTGRTPVLDAMEWAGLFGGNGTDDGGDGLPLQGLDLVAGRLQLLGASFPDTRVTAGPRGGRTEVRLDGPALAGSVQLPRGEGDALAAHLRRLHWTRAPSAASRATADRSRTTGAAPTATQGSAAGAPAADAGSGFDPAAIPPLAIVVDELRLADAPLGRLEVRTRPQAGGLRVDLFQLRSPGQSVDVAGAWTGRGALARTRMQVDVDSRDFGALLARLGVGGRIDGGTGTARFDATWPGSPAGFRLAGLEGALQLSVRDGRLVEVEPGAGRVLGLLSVAELPRRLMLDFRDLFARGFAFNHVGGRVVFDDGTARGEGLVIDGPAAEIHIGGSADLRAQTYDQVIDVFPRTGGLLTAVGAITAGPVGAAVGAVANAVLERPLGRMGARSYHVSGPWKDPKVVVEGRELPDRGGDPPRGDAAPAPAVPDPDARATPRAADPP